MTAQRLPPLAKPSEPQQYDTFRCDDCRTNGCSIRGSAVIVERGIRWRVCGVCDTKRAAKQQGTP